MIRYFELYPHPYENPRGQHDNCRWGAQPGEHCGYARREHRWPCSDTCTHDDAWTPGHPERVKERSKDLRAMTDTASAKGNAWAKAFDEGAEAMREACLAEIYVVCTGMGILDVYERFKAAIEGATP